MSDTPAAPIKRRNISEKAKRRTEKTPDEIAHAAALRESRVAYVADIMRKLQFRPGATNEYLRAQWGIPEYAMARIAVEASRRVREEYANHDTTMAIGLTALDHVLVDALAAGDRKSILRVVELWMQVTGAGAATKVQVSADLSSLTPEQLAARKQEILARLMGQGIQVREVPEGK